MDLLPANNASRWGAAGFTTWLCRPGDRCFVCAARGHFRRARGSNLIGHRGHRLGTRPLGRSDTRHPSPQPRAVPDARSNTEFEMRQLQDTIHRPRPRPRGTACVSKSVAEHWTAAAFPRAVLPSPTSASACAGRAAASVLAVAVRRSSHTTTLTRRLNHCPVSHK